MTGDAARKSSNMAAAIIAGGRALRMGGRPKGLFEVGGIKIINRQLNVLRRAFGRVFLVANDAKDWRACGLDIVPDRVPAGAGPLAGIDAALHVLRPDETAVVCVGGDMPFLSEGSLILLRDHEPAADAVLPIVGTRPEPLFARYGRACAPIISACLAQGRFKATTFLGQVRVAWIEETQLRALDPQLTFLENINHPEDLRRAENLVRRGATRPRSA